jgi:hypothetical protein
VAALLDTYCHALWSLGFDCSCNFGDGPDRNIIFSRPTVLRELHIDEYGFPLFAYSIISQSPDLTRLKLTANETTDEITRGFGEKLEHLMLCVQRKLPRIGCMNLKSLSLQINTFELYDEDIFDDSEAGDLSNIRCLDISLVSTEEDELTQEQATSVMRSYNIGRHLEGLILFGHHEPVAVYWGDICSQAPILRTLTILVEEAYVSDSELMRESMSYETIRELEARGISVTVTGRDTFDGKTCNTCRGVHCGRNDVDGLHTSYLDGSRRLN